MGRTGCSWHCWVEAAVVEAAPVCPSDWQPSPGWHCFAGEQGIACRELLHSAVVACFPAPQPHAAAGRWQRRR